MLAHQFALGVVITNNVIFTVPGHLKALNEPIQSLNIAQHTHLLLCVKWLILMLQPFFLADDDSKAKYVCSMLVSVLMSHRLFVEGQSCIHAGMQPP